MKTIKTNLYAILFLATIVVNGQIVEESNAIEAFHNTTWEWTDGTNTFQVTLLDSGFERAEPLDGLTFFLIYKMIDNSGNIIYETRPSVIDYNGTLPFGGILGATNDPVPNLYGQIDDFSDSNYEYWISGMLKITFIPCSGLGCTPQISWEITKPKELVQDPSAPDDYNLPTDIILTKVE